MAQVSLRELEEAYANAKEAAARGDEQARQDVQLLARMIQQANEGKKNFQAGGIAQSSDLYQLDQAKKGLALGAGVIGAMPQIGIDTSGGSVSMSLSPGNQEQAQKRAEDKLGVQNYQPPLGASPREEYVGMGIQMASDPTSYAGGGLAKGWKGVKAALDILNRAGESFMAGYMGEMAGDYAEQMGGGELAQEAATLAGSIAGSYGAGTVKRTVGTGVKAGTEAIKAGKGLKSLAEDKVAFQARQHVENTIRAALAYNPKLADTIQELAGKYAAKGIDIPLNVLVDNPVIDAEVRHLASVDPEFGAQYMRQWEDGRQSMRMMKDSMFGSPTEAKEALGTSPDTLARKKLEIEQRLDQRATEASRSVAPDYMAPSASERLGKLSTSVEPPVSPRAASIYRQLDETAANEYIPEQEVKNIYRLARGDQKDSPFTKFPSLWNKITQVLKPAVDQTDTGFIEQFDPLDYKAFRSLQSEAKTALRSLNKNSETYQQDAYNLGRLIETLDTSAQSLPKDVYNRLKLADRMYAFDATVNDFATSVFNSNGQIDVKKAEEWMKDPRNRRAMTSMVDPVTGESLGPLVATPATMVAKLMQRKDRVNSIYTRMVASKLADDAGMSGEKMLQKMYDDPTYVGTVLKKYSNRPEILNALRSFALDDIVASRDPLTTLLEDRNKAQVYNRIFGAEFNKRVNELAFILSKLSPENNPAKFTFDRNKGVSQDWLEETINVPAGMIFSKLRNPIISKWQAFVELASRGLTTRSNQQYEMAMKRLMLDPKAMSSFISEMKDVAQDSSKKIDLDKLNQWAERYGINDYITQSFGSAGRGAVIGAKQVTMPEDEEEMR